MARYERITDLPNDVLFKVIECLPPLQRGRLAATCLRLHELVVDGAAWPIVDSRQLGMKFGDAALQLLAQGNTHTLILHGSAAINHGPKSLTDTGIQAVLPRLGALTTLDFTNMRHLHKETFSGIAEHCPNLRSLNVKNCRVVTDEELAAICSHCLHITALSLVNCKRITGAGFAVIQQLAQLTDLDLWGCPAISIESLTTIVTHCTAINKLNLRFCHEVNDEFLSVLAQALPGLRWLDIGYDMFVTGNGIQPLSALPLLVSLCIRECYHVKPDDILKFNERAPQCQVAHDRDAAL